MTRILFTLFSISIGINALIVGPSFNFGFIPDICFAFLLVMLIEFIIKEFRKNNKKNSK